MLQLDDQIQSLAQEMYQQKSLLVMGRGFQFATCLEGALVSHEKNFCSLFFTDIMECLLFFILCAAHCSHVSPLTILFVLNVNY